jgi:hypothetical protein
MVSRGAIVCGGLLGLLIVGLVMFLAAYALRGERPTITTAHVINLDRDTKKLAAFMEQSTPFPVERWPATYGKDLKATALPAQGIGNILVQSGKGTRSLLQHCATLPLPDTAGHLILEDDAAFPEDFQKRWEDVKYRIPTDWDLVYLGINGPKGHVVSKGVLKLYSVKDSSGNWGTHAYIVRHGALRARVLPALQRMFEAIDGQLNALFDEWNVYAVDPTLVQLDDALPSTIQTM